MFNAFLHNYDSENPNLKPCPFCGNNPVLAFARLEVIQLY